MALLAQGTGDKLRLGRAVAPDLNPPFMPFRAGDQNPGFGGAHEERYIPLAALPPVLEGSAQGWSGFR